MKSVGKIIYGLPQSKQLRVSSDISKGFDIGFDDDIPEKMRNKLRRFITHIEENFNMRISGYFNRIANKMYDRYTPDEDDVNEIFAEYSKALN